MYMTLVHNMLDTCRTANIDRCLDSIVVILQALVDEGKIKYVGLSEVSADDLRKAHKVHPITAVQLEWSLWTRDAEVWPQLSCSAASDSALGTIWAAGHVCSLSPDW